MENSHESVSGQENKIEEFVLGVIGCGPKSLAIAAKAKILSQLGIGNVRVEIFEANEVAGNWVGRHGFTDGEQTLGTPPEKDLGFPYNSTFGDKVNEEMLKYSWQMFKIEKQEYGSWVDRG